MYLLVGEICYGTAMNDGCKTKERQNALHFLAHLDKFVYAYTYHKRIHLELRMSEMTSLIKR